MGVWVCGPILSSCPPLPSPPLPSTLSHILILLLLCMHEYLQWKLEHHPRLGSPCQWSRIWVGAHYATPFTPFYSPCLAKDPLPRWQPKNPKRHSVSRGENDFSPVFVRACVSILWDTTYVMFQRTSEINWPTFRNWIESNYLPLGWAWRRSYSLHTMQFRNQWFGPWSMACQARLRITNSSLLWLSSFVGNSGKSILGRGRVLEISQKNRMFPFPLIVQV